MASDSRGPEIRSFYGNHNRNGSLCVSTFNRCPKSHKASYVFSRTHHGTFAPQERIRYAGDNLSCCLQCLGGMVLAIAGSVRHEEIFADINIFADGLGVVR